MVFTAGIFVCYFTVCVNQAPKMSYFHRLNNFHVQKLAPFQKQTVKLVLNQILRFMEWWTLSENKGKLNKGLPFTLNNGITPSCLVQLLGNILFNRQAKWRVLWNTIAKDIDCFPKRRKIDHGRWICCLKMQPNALQINFLIDKIDRDFFCCNLFLHRPHKIVQLMQLLNWFNQHFCFI